MRIRALIVTTLLLAPLVPAATLPRVSPELTMQRYGGPPFRLSMFAGKTIALVFMHTTCKYCQDLTRLLPGLQKEYEARNVLFVECAFNDDAPATMAPFYKVFQPTFPVGYTNEATVKSYLKWDDKKDGIMMIPHMVFIDSSGMIVEDHGENGFFGAETTNNIHAVLNRMLSKAPAAAPKKK